MEFCLNIIAFLFVLIALIISHNTAQSQTVQEISFTFNNTEFGFFQTSSTINQSIAQTQCINWGGNLATIKSAVEDSLLFYSSSDIGTVFTCHIGLSGTNGTNFGWIDGGISSYRNWGTTSKEYPLPNRSFNCVRTRYRVGGTQLSQGWLNVGCSEDRNCYMCSKSGMSNGCDLIYNSSCYKLFEASTPINWLDAQSSCAIWGGDLTSIATERENNYLNTMIISSVGNVWIGLNDRDAGGTYTWVGGTAVSYTNWTSTPPNISNSCCVQINNTGNGMWESVSCEMTLNTFLCKRNLSSNVPTVGRFGRITNGALEFEELTGNTFFFEPQTLVCGSGSSLVEWIYSQNSNLSDGHTIPETNNYVDFSWLDVSTTMQGYYQCVISNSVSYTVGVYDTTLITVAVTGDSYTYIVGVDRTDVLLLCDPEDGGSLSTLKWSAQGGMEFNNPINLYSKSIKLFNVLTYFSCMRGVNKLNTIQICVKVPTISISYGAVPVTSFSSVYPAMNTLSVPSAVQNCILSVNIEGKWNLPDKTNSTNSALTIPNFSSQNNGVYKLYINNWDDVEVCVIQVELTTTNVITGDPDTQLAYDNTLFGYFSNSPAVDWYTAQLRCLNWGGNLATINSKEEDTLLYYSSTDIQSHFACFIGLNDILNEAGTDGSAYTWVDGSSSDYRNFETSFPKDVTDRDCVRFRYKMAGGVLSKGWINQVSSIEINCHFCSKPATSADCDLIYDGSCYKVLEVSTPINWLDAQSSCAIWGGDLTSIITERENNYLNTMITSSVGNCWIGLNDRDVEATYTWIDGTAVRYTNWTSTPPNIANSDCVQINNAGCGMWEFVSCEMTLNAFLCKRDSSSNVLTGSRFGRITNGGLKFEDLVGNRFFYESQTLVCGGDGSSVVWRYSQNSDLSDAMVISETSNYVDFSWLDANTTVQGYYQCMISNSVSYTVGLYNETLTTVAETGANYTYVIGIDRMDVLLLCDPEDGGGLSMLRWSVQGGMEFLNPINLYSESNYLPDVLTSFSCRRGGDTLNTTHICVKVPTISISYGVVPVTNYSSVYPAVNTLSVPSAVQYITLSININGKWNLPDITNTTNSALTIPNFSSQNNGVYKFYTDNWDGVQVCVIQIELTSTNIISGDPDTQLTYNNTLFGYFSNSPSIDWYTAQLRCLDWGGNLATINSKEEDSLLYYSSTDIQSHFACYIGLNDIQNEAGTDGSLYTWVDGSSSDYRNFGTDFPKNVTDHDCVRFRYLTGTDAVSDGWNNQVCSRIINCHFCSKPATSGDCDLIYDSSCYEVFEVSTPINWLDAQSTCAIWGGDLTSITTERENNYLNTMITSSVGNCWIGLNDRDVEGTYTWIDGTAVSDTNWTSTPSNIANRDCIKLNNTGNGYWYSVNCEDKSNTFLCKRPSNASFQGQFGQLVNGGLDFEPLQNNTVFQGSLTLVCRGDGTSVIEWIYSQNLDLSDSEKVNATYYNREYGLSWLNIDDSQPGVYKCQIHKTSYIHVVPSVTPTSNSSETPTSNSSETPTSSSSTNSSLTIVIVIAVILVPLMICLIVITIIIICVWRRRTSSPFSKQRLKTDYDTPIKQMTLIKDRSDNPGYAQEHNNQAYIQLDNIVETDFTHANSPSKTQSNQRDSEITYEEVTEIIDPRIIPIPLDVFKIHMNKIWKNEGALLEEYESLGGKSHRYACTHGTIEENKLKNRFKLIYPYDKSRVTLIPNNNSANCDYINASMIPGYYSKECFIAAQGPKENTMQDFWKMILEKNIVNIVMVTNLVESGRRKCEAYFSLKIGERVVIGPYEINLDKEEVRTGYIIRKMSVHHMGNVTQVKHFHFTAWPDHDVPSLYDELLLFVSKVQVGRIKTNAPILVHCSAGVGRTGTFIALYNLLTAIQQNKPINIYSTVNAMREHRPQMVQAFSQYKFIYLSVLEILLGNTSIPKCEFLETFNSYMKSEETGYVSVFFQQFSELNYQCEKAFDPVCTAALEGCNSKKNPINDILPNDDNRVVLYSGQWDEDYINASKIEGGEIILTIHPTADTLQNFYQLLHQVGPSLVVMLCSKKELQSIQQNTSQRVSYWPNLGETLQTDSFMITCEDNEKSHFIRNKLRLQHVEEQSNKYFTQIITDGWNENGEPDLKKNVFILQAMVEFRKQYPNGPIVIHCKDGAGMSGVLYTVYKSIKDGTEKGFIDIFHIVKKLRNERMNSVTFLNQFLACYTLLNEYMYKNQ